MIKSTANNIYQRYAQEFPIDPELIDERMGILVEEQHWAFSNPSCSGAAFIRDGQKVIQYESSHSRVRQRFTIAHELGHHVLGHTAQGKQFRDTPNNYRMSSAPAEVEANTFAAELLMPASVVDFAIFTKNIRGIKNLAKAFDVSEAAMAIRLKTLGVIHEHN